MIRIPTLTDGVVRLRAPNDDDIEGSYEQCQDPLSQRWTRIPVPYTREDAKTYLRHIIPGGWETEREWGFVVEAPDEVGALRFAGSISLRNEGDGRAEIAYGSHPWVRGRGVMEHALRLLLDWGFAERDLQTISWLARRGNWASRRLAWRLGFSVDGTLRHWLPQRGELADAWVGTLRRGDVRAPRTPWLESPTITGERVVLREMRAADLSRIVETSSDPETQRWLQSAREEAPHSLESHAGFLDARLEQAANGEAVHWAIADPESDAYLGQVSLFGVHHGREAELAYWSHPDARGRGVTTEASRLLVRHCFIPQEDGGLGLRRLTANAAVGNNASHRLLERAGFVRIGVERKSTLLPDGSYVGAILYDQLLDDFAEPSRRGPVLRVRPATR
jgi:RimJ/RimL family protein N-acetyltransferase